MTMVRASFRIEGTDKAMESLRDALDRLNAALVATNSAQRAIHECEQQLRDVIVVATTERDGEGEANAA